MDKISQSVQMEKSGVSEQKKNYLMDTGNIQEGKEKLDSSGINREIVKSLLRMYFSTTDRANLESRLIKQLSNLYT